MYHDDNLSYFRILFLIFMSAVMFNSSTLNEILQYLSLIYRHITPLEHINLFVPKNMEIYG